MSQMLDFLYQLLWQDVPMLISKFRQIKCLQKNNLMKFLYQLVLGFQFYIKQNTLYLSRLNCQWVYLVLCSLSCSVRLCLYCRVLIPSVLTLYTLAASSCSVIMCLYCRVLTPSVLMTLYTLASSYNRLPEMQEGGDTCGIHINQVKSFYFQQVFSIVSQSKFFHE